MVVHLPGNPDPLVLESTTLSESSDVTLGCPVAGVALVPLADKLRDYPGTVALRRRHGPPLSDRQQQLLTRLVKRLLHRPYKNYVLCNALDVGAGGYLVHFLRCRSDSHLKRCYSLRSPLRGRPAGVTPLRSVPTAAL